MSEWPIKTIAECASPEPYSTQIGPFGKALMAKEYTVSGVPVLRGVNVNAGRFYDDGFVFISEEKADELAKYESYPGDVLLVHKGTLGEIGLMPESRKHSRYIMGNSMMRVRCDRAKLLPEYLYYWLTSSDGQHYLFSRVSQVGVPQLQRPLTTLREAAFPVPPLPQQRRIAHILGTLDDKIELNRRMNRTLEAIARAIFKSWFIDFDPVIDNAILNGKPIPDEFAERAEVRREILARSQPSPPTPLPEVEGRNYRGGFGFAGLVEKARELRRKETPAEEILWELLRDRRLLDLKFRRQHQIGDYVADFYCHERELVIELDGGIHRTREAKDAKRDAYMQTLGLTVLRIPNADVLENPDGVLSRIMEVVQLSPSPSGRGGGEGVASYRHLFPDSFQDSPPRQDPEGMGGPSCR